MSVKKKTFKTINIDVLDVDHARVVHALCASGGFLEETEDNARLSVLEWVKATVRNVERSDADRKARMAETDVSDVELV